MKRLSLAAIRFSEESRVGECGERRTAKGE
jgi:hypothetical protein